MRIKEIGDYIQVDVRDNGMGIPKTDTEKIFDRFYRSDASRNSDKGGNGIGLSIAKKIIEDHGGRIWATVDGSVGLTIHFTLRKYTEEIKADYTKEPKQINIDIENANYEDIEDTLSEEEKKDISETTVNSSELGEEVDEEAGKLRDDGELDDDDDMDEQAISKKYDEMISMLDEFDS
jgi:hypothetical protein